VHAFCVAGAGGEHEWCLVVFVQGDAIFFVACLEEHAHDGQETEGGGEVEGGVGEACGGGVGVVEEVGVCF